MLNGIHSTTPCVRVDVECKYIFGYFQLTKSNFKMILYSKMQGTWFRVEKIRDIELTQKPFKFTSLKSNYIFIAQLM